MRIVIPKKLKPLEVSAVLATLQNRVGEREIEIDFSALEFAYPFGSIALLVGLKGIQNIRGLNGLDTRWRVDVENSQGCSYLQRFGFFDHLGLAAQVPSNQLRFENARFMFIERISKHDFEFEGVPIQEKLDHFCTHLSKMILTQDADDLPQVQAVAWSLREIIRNVFEHAQVDDAYVTAQSWSTGWTEIAIGDCGIGIASALSKTFEIKAGAEALEMAILPGITEYSGPETISKWQNSGYGLYMLSEVAKQFGAFQLASSGALLSADGVRTNTIASGFLSGTTASLRLNVPPDVYWTNFLERAKCLGEERSKTIPGARHKASASSGTPWSQRA